MARLLIAPIDSRGAHPSSFQTAVERLLGEEGIGIDRAGDAADAARRFASAEHDLLILTHDDLTHEWRSVAAAVQGLRQRAAQEGRRFVPVLVLSSAPEYAAVGEARDLGADDVLPLGATPQVLCSRVRAYLALSARQSRPSAAPGRAMPSSGAHSGSFRHELTQRLVHDLRNPLAGLTSNLAYVDDRLGTAADPEVLEALADCRSAVGRLRRSATMLVDLSRLEDGTLKPRIGTAPVVPVLQEVFGQRMHEAALRELKLLGDVPPGLSAVFDSELCGRLLHALLDHALRYAPTGSTVLISATLRGERGLSLLVSAEGEWLPKAERLASGHGAPPGMIEVGLGLHYARLAAVAHGGSMEVLDQPGQQGLTVVRITL